MAATDGGAKISQETESKSREGEESQEMEDEVFETGSAAERGQQAKPSTTKWSTVTLEDSPGSSPSKQLNNVSRGLPV